ncbi:sugar ABC transporter permease [Streptomyces misionensis]|uniref:carbohydrate ABC transporter permease n=1 Tax=Streptomyces misionensis TaxID=67331 RepID=UPI0033DDF78D
MTSVFSSSNDASTGLPGGSEVIVLPDGRTRANRPARADGSAADRARSGMGWGFTAPFLILYALFLVGPTLYNVVSSLFNTSLVKPGLGEFVGLSNYRQALGDPEFWRTFGHTLWFTVLTSVPLVILSLLLALLADRFAHGKWFFRCAFFAPYVLPSAVIVLIWKWMYADQVGLVPAIFGGLGITSPSFLGDPAWSMTAVAITTIWWTLGFNFILYLAGLQEIPREVHEAAAIDGAGPWQRIRHIVVPMLSRTTALVAVLQVIASLKIFDQIYLMTSGGPDGSTRPSLEYIYDTGFTDYRAGYASTVAVVFVLIVLAVSLAWVALNRRNGKAA